MLHQQIQQLLTEFEIPPENQAAEVLALFTGEFVPANSVLKDVLGLASDQIQEWANDGILCRKLSDRIAQTMEDPGIWTEQDEKKLQELKSFFDAGIANAEKINEVRRVLGLESV